MDVYERELGWSFWTWKLDQHAEATALSAPLWSFRLVSQCVSAGWWWLLWLVSGVLWWDDGPVLYCCFVWMVVRSS